MKSSIPFFTLALASIAFSQGTAPSPAPNQASTPASSTAELKARGPEAVAKQDPNRVIATIDGKQITAKQAAELLKPLAPEVRKRYENQLPQLVQQAYMQEQLAQEATKLNLDQQSPWKEQIEMARASILTQAYFTKASTAGSTTVPAADAQKYYDSHPEEFDQVKLSGIFIAFSGPGTPASGPNAQRTEEQAREKANDIEKKLKSGTDFATVARTDSDNQQSAAQGGSLGTYSPSDARLPVDVKTAVAKLKAGEVSDPVRVPGAFLILKVDTRTKLSFDQAHPAIAQKLLSDKYKIQVQDQDFFNAPTASNIPSLQRSAPSPSSQPPAQSSQAPPKPQPQP